jgi:hypothetical protein
VVADHHIVTAIGVDADGIKHLLGLTAGSSENARVVKDLLPSLIARGVSADDETLFVMNPAFRRMQGFRDLWVLTAALGRQKVDDVVQEPKVALSVNRPPSEPSTTRGTSPKTSINRPYVRSIPR